MIFSSCLDKSFHLCASFTDQGRFTGFGVWIEDKVEQLWLYNQASFMQISAACVARIHLFQQLTVASLTQQGYFGKGCLSRSEPEYQRFVDLVDAGLQERGAIFLFNQSQKIKRTSLAAIQ